MARMIFLKKRKSSQDTDSRMGCSGWLWSGTVACMLILLLVGPKNTFGIEDMSMDILPVFRPNAPFIHLKAVKSTRLGSGRNPKEVHRYLMDTLPLTTDPNIEQLDSPNDSSNLVSDGTINAYDTAPAVMMAIASMVILSAAALYLYDLRHRCRRESRGGSWSCQDVTISGQTWMGYLWCRKSGSTTMKRNGSFPRLPPPLGSPSPDDDWECVEQVSLSPVSTITASFVMDHCVANLNHCDSDVDLAKSKDIKTLTDLDRVPGGIDLSHLVDLSQINVIAAYTEPNHRSHHDTSIISQDDNKSIEYSPRAFQSTRVDVMSGTDEDESGWTSVDGNSDNSSDTSIGSFLKSATSGRSRSSSLRSMALFSASSIALRRSESRDECGEISGEHSCHAIHADQRQYPIADNCDEIVTIAERNSTLLEYWLERNHLLIQESKGQDSSDDESTEIQDSLGSDDTSSMHYFPVHPTMSTSSGHDRELQDQVWTPGHGNVRWIGQPTNLRMPYREGDEILKLGKTKKVGGLGLETDPVNDGSLKPDGVQSPSPGNEPMHPTLGDSFGESEINSLNAALEGPAVEV